MARIMENPNKVVVSPSKFNMWRTAISLAYCDGHLSNSEASLIHDWWQRFAFTPEQVVQLEHDFRNGVDFEEVYPLITDKLDRAHLIYFALILFHIDDDFSELEQKMWEVLNERHMATIDYKQAVKDAEKAVEDYLEQEKLARAKERAASGPFMKGALYLVDTSMGNNDFDETVW